MEAKMHPSFDIFTTAGGHARYVETVKNLAAARKRLKQLASKSSGDCFLYSIQSGIVELIVRPDLPKRLPKKPARLKLFAGGSLASPTRRYV
jgi:hypothetical protein